MLGGVLQQFDDVIFTDAVGFQLEWDSSNAGQHILLNGYNILWLCLGSREIRLVYMMWYKAVK